MDFLKKFVCIQRSSYDPVVLCRGPCGTSSGAELRRLDIALYHRDTGKVMLVADRPLREYLE